MQFQVQPLTVATPRIPVAAPGNATVSFAFEPGDGWTAPDVRSAWETLVARTDNLNAIFQSPEWFDHRAATARTPLLILATVRDARGAVVGVVPFARERLELAFHARLYHPALRVAMLLGGQPLLPEDPALFDLLFTAAADALPEVDAIQLHMVPRNSFTWAYLQESRVVRERFLLYVPALPGEGATYAIDLPDSFEAYLSMLSAKRRSLFKRRVRQLREHGQGALVLERFDGPGAGEAFLAAAGVIARKTWQRRMGDSFEEGTEWPHRLSDLAARGILRSYLLRCGGVGCAYVMGFQTRGVFHYVKCGYDPAFARLSPGAALLYLLLEDLFTHARPKRVCFCFGDNAYKAELATARNDTAEVLLLAPTTRNRSLRAAHRGFRAGVHAMKVAAARVRGRRA
jgi:CelD/BcsL family acetyltransferase involved in cellulose biosynthesis